MSASHDFRYDPGDDPRDRSLRVGDKERDAVSEILRQRHLEGRLDTEEFQARLERSIAARTYAELDELIADFPRETAERRRAEQPWGRRPWPPAFLVLPLGLLFLFLPLALIASIVGGGHTAWLAVPLFFFVVRPLIWRARGGGHGRGPSACGARRTTRA
jgi:hypothetical protein